MRSENSRVGTHPAQPAKHRKCLGLNMILWSGNKACFTLSLQREVASAYFAVKMAIGFTRFHFYQLQY